MSRTSCSSALVLFVSLTAMIQASQREAYVIHSGFNAPSRQQFAIRRGLALELSYQLLRSVSEQRVRSVPAPGNKMVDETYTEERWVTEVRTRSMPINFVRGLTVDKERVDGDELAKRLERGRMVIVYPKGQEPEPAYLALAKPDTLILFVSPMEEIGFTRVRPEPRLAPPDLKIPLSLGTKASGGSMNLPAARAGQGNNPFPYVVQPEVGFASIDEQSQVKLRQTIGVTAKHRTRAVEGSLAENAPVDIQLMVNAEVTQLIPDEAVQAFDLDGKPVAREAWTRQLKAEAPVVISSGDGPVNPYFLQFVKPGTLVLAVPKMPPWQSPRQRQGPGGNLPDDLAPMPPVPAADPSS